MHRNPAVARRLDHEDLEIRYGPSSPDLNMRSTPDRGKLGERVESTIERTLMGGWEHSSSLL